MYSLLPFSSLSLLPVFAWNVVMISGILVAILDHENEWNGQAL
jgi:hypothetical protein